MDKGENIATIAMKLAITNIVKRYSGVAQQKNGFWLMEQALKGTLTPEFWIAEFEKDFPTKGKEIYDEMVLHYAKTNIQQHEESAIKEQVRQIHLEAKSKIEALKNQFLETETQIMQGKIDEKEEEKKRAEEFKQKREEREKALEESKKKNEERTKAFQERLKLSQQQIPEKPKEEKKPELEEPEIDKRFSTKEAKRI